MAIGAMGRGVGVNPTELPRSPVTSCWDWSYVGLQSDRQPVMVQMA